MTQADSSCGRTPSPPSPTFHRIILSADRGQLEQNEWLIKEEQHITPLTAPCPGVVRGGFTGVFQSPCFCSVPTPTPAGWAGDPRGTVRQERGLPELPRWGLEEDPELVGAEGGRRQVRTGPGEGGPDQLILASHHHAARGLGNYRETRCVCAAPG